MLCCTGRHGWLPGALHDMLLSAESVPESDCWWQFDSTWAPGSCLEVPACSSTGDPAALDARRSCGGMHEPG